MPIAGEMTYFTSSSRLALIRECVSVIDDLGEGDRVEHAAIFSPSVPAYRPTYPSRPWLQPSRRL